MMYLELCYQKRWSSLRVRILLIEHRIANSKSDYTAAFLRHNKDTTINILNEEKEKLPQFIEAHKNKPKTDE